MFRRGFKSWCEETALKVRAHQGLAPIAPLSPFVLARELRVQVIEPSALKDLPEDVCRRLLGEHSDTWSAITIPGERIQLIVYNPRHSAARQNSDLMHELAHILLGHKPTMMFMDPNNDLALRAHNQAQEEANWLAGCLLLPREVLLHIKKTKVGDGLACHQYGGSAKMLTYRMNVSGVNLQGRRAQTWRRR
jgi:hypothetical protein